MRLFLLCILIFSSLCAEDYREVFMKKFGCQTYSFFSSTEYKKVALVALFQAAYESNWGRAHWVEKRNQVFAMKVYTGGKLDKSKRPWEYIREFNSFDEALVAQLSYYRKRKYPAEPSAFVEALGKHGYAQRGDYVHKVSSGYGSMLKYVRRHCDCEVR